MEYEDHIHYVCGSPEMVRIPKGGKAMFNKAITDERPESSGSHDIACPQCNKPMIWYGTATKGSWMCKPCDVIRTPNIPEPLGLGKSITITYDGKQLANNIMPYLLDNIKQQMAARAE